MKMIRYFFVKIWIIFLLIIELNNINCKETSSYNLKLSEDYSSSGSSSLDFEKSLGNSNTQSNDEVDDKVVDDNKKVNNLEEKNLKTSIDETVSSEAIGLFQSSDFDSSDQKQDDDLVEERESAIKMDGKPPILEEGIKFNIKKEKTKVNDDENLKPSLLEDSNSLSSSNNIKPSNESMILNSSNDKELSKEDSSSEDYDEFPSSSVERIDNSNEESDKRLEKSIMNTEETERNDDTIMNEKSEDVDVNIDNNSKKTSNKFSQELKLNSDIIQDNNQSSNSQSESSEEESNFSSDLDNGSEQLEQINLQKEKDLKNNNLHNELKIDLENESNNKFDNEIKEESERLSVKQEDKLEDKLVEKLESESKNELKDKPISISRRNRRIKIMTSNGVFQLANEINKAKEKKKRRFFKKLFKQLDYKDVVLISNIVIQEKSSREEDKVRKSLTSSIPETPLIGREWIQKEKLRSRK